MNPITTEGEFRYSGRISTFLIHSFSVRNSIVNGGQFFTPIISMYKSVHIKRDVRLVINLCTVCFQSSLVFEDFFFLINVPLVSNVKFQPIKIVLKK